MRHIIAIIDEDREYVSKLSIYMNKKSWIELKAMAFYSLEEYISEYHSFTTEILLMSEKIFKKLEHSKMPKTTFILLEDHLCDMDVPENIYVINKYISVEQTLKIIMDYYSPTGENILVNTQKGKVEVLGVFSPLNRCGKTSFGATLTIQLAKIKPTLFISFDEYQGILSKDVDKDLSDIMYYYKQGKYSWNRLSTVVCSEYGLDYIPSARYPEDIMELSVVEIGDLLQRIVQESKYESIVIDFGNMGKRSCELFKLCNRIYMPILKDSASQNRIIEFYQYLELTGRESLKDKICEITLPFLKIESEHKLYGLLHSALGEYIETMLCQERG